MNGKPGLFASLARASRPARLAALLLPVILAAGDNSPRPVRGDEFSASGPPPTLLVLFDGRILRGRISERPGGYLVEQPNGSGIVIPFQHVRLAAVSLEEAYIKQRDSMNAPTAGDHLELAKWCYENRLYAFARDEVAEALRLEPLRSDARELLRNIADAEPGLFEPSGGAPKANTAEPGRGPAPERTAAGLQLETNADFVRRIQPLLINKCGNASCHGSASPSTFRLLNVRSGRRQQRLETTTNLASVLEQIDPRRPEQSPLLRQAVDGNSTVHQSLFDGPGGRTQLENLRAWVARAAADLQQVDPAASEWVAQDPGPPADFAWDDPPVIEQASHEAPIESPLLIEIPRTPVKKPPAAPVARRRAASAPAEADDRPTGDLLKSILDEERADAFDPDEFNRKVHGTPARTSR